MLPVKKQGDVKGMCFVAIHDGKILDPVWFEDEQTKKSISVNTSEYVKMLKKSILPKLKVMPKFKSKKIWWQQDGASCHCSKESLDFLKSVFGDRIISRRCDVCWPAASPDLNPLDFSLWSIIEDYVFKSNPSTLLQVKKKVQECIDDLNKDPAKVRRIVGNMYKRARMCRNENGGHFEHKM